MPTPSAPDPLTPYPFASTCPEPDERHDTPMNDVAAAAHRDVTTPVAIPRFASSDGPVPDSDAVSSPPSGASRRGVDFHHKPADDVELDRSQSPCGSSPVEPIQTLRPRQGVGTSHLSMEESAAQDPGSEYAVEEDYGLPSMGYGFSNRRVCSQPTKEPGRWTEKRDAAVLRVINGERSTQEADKVVCRQSPTRRRPFCAPAAALLGHSSPSGRCTKYRSRSNMSIYASPFSAAIFGFRVCLSALRPCCDPATYKTSY